MDAAEVFHDYLAAIENEKHRDQMQEIFSWVISRFPELKPKIAWNQPMFTDHGTFIIGFSISKQHFAISPEAESMNVFSESIAKSGYSMGSNIFRIKWTDQVDYTLLEQIILYNIKEKAQCSTFWRK